MNCLPVIDSLDRALEVADKANPDLAPMVEGIELTLKSMLDVVRKFGVEVIADTNVPLDPNVHQAIAMVESEDVAAGNAGRDAERLYPERPYYSRRDGDGSESEITSAALLNGCPRAAVFMPPLPARDKNGGPQPTVMLIPSLARYSATLSA